MLGTVISNGTSASGSIVENLSKLPEMWDATETLDAWQSYDAVNLNITFGDFEHLPTFITLWFTVPPKS